MQEVPTSHLGHFEELLEATLCRGLLKLTGELSSSDARAVILIISFLIKATVSGKR